MIRRSNFESKEIVYGSGEGERSEQHVCKVILVISLGKHSN